MKQKPCIGLTMRIVTEYYPSGAHEKRDALAHDWADFLRFALPSVTWVALPNEGEDTVLRAKDLGVQGLVLTGGNDIGEQVQRDVSERALLTWAREEKLPVLGICRGAQMLNVFCGGSLAHVHFVQKHANTRHSLTLREEFQSLLPAEVNSYHMYGITKDGLAPALRAVALAQDESIEAFMHKNLPWLGLMWHPEREKKYSEHDIELFHALFVQRAMQ